MWVSLVLCPFGVCVNIPVPMSLPGFGRGGYLGEGEYLGEYSRDKNTGDKNTGVSTYPQTWDLGVSI